MGSDTAVALEKPALYSSSRLQHVRDRRPSFTKLIEASGTERTTVAQCFRTASYPPDAKHRIVHSDNSETTADTCSSGGGGVCSDDSRTTADSTTSCSTSRKNNVVALQLQKLALCSSCPNPYFLDSADRLINLPDDLIKEVLGRLSVKEIVRMGCLNRSWRSEMRRFITDEQFNYC
jgi:hypothetical protein